MTKNVRVKVNQGAIDALGAQIAAKADAAVNGAANRLRGNGDPELVLRELIAAMNSVGVTVNDDTQLRAMAEKVAAGE